MSVKIMPKYFVVFIFLLISIVLSAQDSTYQNQGITSPERGLPIFYEKLKDKMNFLMGWHDTISAPVKWREEGRLKAREIIIPDLDIFPFNPVVISETDKGSYTAQKVVFNISAESRVLAILLIPDGEGPFPAALMLHDHGSKFDIGKEKFVETWDDSAKLFSSKEWSEKYFSGRFPGDELAKRGYVVLSIDAFAWGDRSVAGFRMESQQALASNLFNLGSSFAGIIAAEDVRAAGYLASLSFVDKSRIAAVGFSMGAFRAWQVAALSDDITAYISVCWMATVKGLMVPGNNQLKGYSSFAMLHPGILRYFDYPDIAGLAAPKPALFFAGEEDKLFPVNSVNDAWQKLARIYEQFDAPDSFQTKLWLQKGHTFTSDMQDYAFDWLDTRFNNHKNK